ncbi:hypothetical protein [Aestuariibacter salexigens]|uniref:hypothetical protein n=1 Tax=Aestuariibacter salexigens TaxID=226010 RepID=UPI00040AFAAA|nr:hypothetical protein [Aestuariibacter salexigens]
MYQQHEVKYVALLSSLPSAERLFQAKQTPISRLKLEQRLSALEPPERRVLESIEGVLDRRFVDVAKDDEEVLQRATEALKQIKHQTLRNILVQRLDMRTLVKALRLKHVNSGEPPLSAWGFSRWCRHIESHWNEPGFALVHVFPWVSEAQHFIINNQPLKLEKLLLQQAYNSLVRHGGQHHFDFEAVVIYVLKWNIINRQVKYNSMAAERRFTHLITQGIAHLITDMETSAYGE